MPAIDSENRYSADVCSSLFVDFHTVIVVRQHLPESDQLDDLSATCVEHCGSISVQFLLRPHARKEFVVCSHGKDLVAVAAQKTVVTLITHVLASRDIKHSGAGIFLPEASVALQDSCEHDSRDMVHQVMSQHATGIAESIRKRG